MFPEAIFQDVLAAMQPAEELEGPTGEDYLQLMERIAVEASTRAAVYRDVLAESSDVAAP